jgi:archaetidylinositol phosphate synthase
LFDVALTPHALWFAIVPREIAIQPKPNGLGREATMAAQANHAMTDFCEQVNPRLLSEMRRRPVHADRRIQQSWVAGPEKRALLWLAAHTPERVNSDHLTVLGFLAQLAAGGFYLLARFDRFALLGVIACLGLNWLGDSLDGTLARVRVQQRPRYGFYVDHMVDTLGAIGLMGGLAVSGYMHPWIAMDLLVGFLVLSIQSYLATHSLGEFRLSFWRFGPTELRILLGVGNFVLLWKPIAHIFGRAYRLFDVGGVIGIAGMAAMVIAFTIQNTIRLYHDEKIAK